MNFKIYFFVTLIYYTNCERKILQSQNKVKSAARNSKTSLDTSDSVKNFNETRKDGVIATKPIDLGKVSNILKIKIPPPPSREKHATKMIPPDLLQQWAEEISETFYKIEKQVVRREVLLKSFSDIKIEVRNGSAIVEKMASALEDLLQRRVQAAENIMRKAESLAMNRTAPPSSYTFQLSSHLNEIKKKEKQDPHSEWVQPENCTQLGKLNVSRGTHFAGAVSLEAASVHVAAEVFACNPRVKDHIYWSEDLLSAFRQNYAHDSSVDFQYFCSAKGFMRHYPAGLWSSMFSLELNSDESESGVADVYDCRLRPWYVAAGGAPRDVLVLFDGSGSMSNTSNLVNAEQFTLALLSALTDDDRVNVLRFNVKVESPISCFNDKMLPANYVNSAAMMAALRLYPVINESRISLVLEESVAMLRRQQADPDRAPACQQVVILITDSLYKNYTQKMRDLDPSGRIRLFVVWLHDPYGLRDNTRDFGEWLSCSSDGLFVELVTHADVTEQVMRILSVLERPLVAQRSKRIKVFSDVYAHVEDPRRSEYYWMQKENEEQGYRYKQLRLNKRRLVSEVQRHKDYMRHESLDKAGHYYEGQDLNYRLQISVSVPVFDKTESENITITLNEEKQRKSTRTYPVNRLLGVAGVDIPIDHLKLILPYHQLGAGGSLFLIDHRGNIVLHDNTKPTFDGDILKPGYRTVDVLDLEQPDVDLEPREYSREWLEFRKALVIEEPNGSRSMFSKNIFEDGMRALLEFRVYHWRRVMDHYTAVVVLPRYSQHHAVPDGTFTQELAAAASDALRLEHSVHPDWLYCRHVDPRFDEREAEVRHFVSRRKDEPNFQMQKLKHVFSPIKFIPLLEKTYQCNEELMARLCKEAVATAQWANYSSTDHDCSPCKLGSVTAFFASESGLTRWQQYHATSAHAQPPDGSAWPRGPTEPWYKRAAAAAPDTLVVHAPVAPIRKMRNTDRQPPPLGARYKWFTAARTLGHPDKGIVGVAGYHFYPKHLEDVLKAVTNFPCTDEDDCEPRCDGEDWTCVLVDDGGWVVAGHWREDEELTEEDPVREHLARLYPKAMYALLAASVYKLHWVHDYQGVCFTPQDETATGFASIMPSLLRSLWRSVFAIFHVTREVVTIFTLVSSGSLVAADTELEREKRRNRTLRDYDREKFDRLYDPRVLVNRTRFSACDRSRAFYELQRTPKAMDALKRPMKPDRCSSWPLVGTVVPKTNLLLLAIFNSCKHHDDGSGRPLPDPFANEPVDMSSGDARETSAKRLACWRNRVQLPARPPHTACYPHNYKQEEGYRQCGPWFPDLDQEEDTAGRTSVSNNLLCIALWLYAVRLRVF